VTEYDGTRAAHRRDGAALTRFLASARARGADKAASRDRRKRPDRAAAPGKNRSFPTIGDSRTISGDGSKRRDRPLSGDDGEREALELGTLYLSISTAPVLTETTDVTRTIGDGEPTREMRDRFTACSGTYRARFGALSEGHHRGPSSTASRGGRFGRRARFTTTARARCRQLSRRA